MRLVLVFHALFCTLILDVVENKDKSAKYYKQVWDESYMKSFSWKRPKFNEDFKILNGQCKELPKYDFVIVGAGSAGAVIANRLSENPDWKILLIEAGGEETDFSLIPGAFFPLHNSDKNWGYLTTPQKNACLNMKNNQCDFARGKGLGGTSSINGMYHVRGNEFDDWKLPGWSFKDLLKYFKKSEAVYGMKNINKYFRGTKGPLSVSYPNTTTKLGDIVFSAYKEMGYSEVDYNGKSQMGYARLQGTINNGKRCSTNQAYLNPIRNNTNLSILTYALATKILFDEEKKAIGVEFRHKDRCKIARFRKELILSAGVINTPQLLLLSGVGPMSDLEKLGIEVISDLPVGLNVEDHVGIINIPTISKFSTKVLTTDEIFNLYANQRGPMSDLTVYQVVFTSANKTLREMKRPEFEILYFTSPSHINPQIYVPFLNFKESFKLKMLFVHSNMISIQLVLLHAKSKGKISLKSNNPLDFPLIDLNLLSHPDDVENLYHGFMDLLKISDTKSFSDIDLEFLLVYPPECLFLRGKEKIVCYIKKNSAGVYHTIGSCRMGISPEDSVVDLDLKIHGLKKIRIVDSSVIPSNTGAHISSLAVAIAEKISDLIKNEYK